ncbi:MAG: hypothetical protein AB7S26_07195 [Sandaracinaceae bacterium]
MSRSSAPRVALGTCLMLGALSLVGCIPQPRMYTARQVHSRLAPYERIARWDGERFVPVERGSIEASHLYVLVHGWAPGWADAVREQPTLRAWDARDGGGHPFQAWFTELARALSQADPFAVVVVYSWLDDAASIPFFFAGRRVMAHTDLHGRWLAQALAEVERPDFAAHNGRVHLIGHSYGARVAAVAASELDELPAQLTMFDPPENAITYMSGSQAGLSRPLRRLPIGSGAGQIFVDNYISMMGQHLHTRAGLEGVVDVYLRPPYGSGEYRRRHNYPMHFYALSAASEIGLAWARLISEAPTPHPGCYEQSYGAMGIHPGCYGTALGPTPGVRGVVF